MPAPRPEARESVPSRRAREVVSLVPYAAVSAVHLGAKIAGATSVERATKPALLPLLGLRLAAGPRTSRRTDAMLIGGLTAGWIGDITIDRSFGTGLGAFLVGHLFLIATFSSKRGRVAPWSLLAIPWLGAVLVELRPRRTGSLFPAVATYGAVLGAMAASATRGNRRTGLGGILFVVSDTMLALRRLTPRLRSPRWGVAVMASYLAAQALLVDGALSRDRPRSRARGSH